MVLIPSNTLVEVLFLRFGLRMTCCIIYAAPIIEGMAVIILPIEKARFCQGSTLVGGVTFALPMLMCCVVTTKQNCAALSAVQSQRRDTKQTTIPLRMMLPLRMDRLLLCGQRRLLLALVCCCFLWFVVDGSWCGSDWTKNNTPQH